MAAAGKESRGESIYDDKKLHVLYAYKALKSPKHSINVNSFLHFPFIPNILYYLS